MIGRGTRLCPDLFGPDEDKEDFRVFDFCFNFDFFRENPEGINASNGPSLGTHLFRARVQLLGHVQANTELDPDATLSTWLADRLYGEVAEMNRENFIVRMHLAAMDRFQQRDAWDQLSEADRKVLTSEVAGLPSEITTDDIQARHFDLTALRMQLAHAEGNAAVFEKGRRRVVEIAMLLEEKKAIPAVAAHLAYIISLQERAFWEGSDLAMLEEMRLCLRELVPLHMTGVQYAKNVEEYLHSHLDDPVIQRLRTNEPFTPTDREALEKTLIAIGEEEGAILLANLLKQRGALSLAHYVLSCVGMDRAAARAACAHFLNEPSLTELQISFIEMVIEQLSARGFLDASALYESPFSDLHGRGPEELFLGQEKVIDGLFETLALLAPKVQSIGE